MLMSVHEGCLTMRAVCHTDITSVAPAVCAVEHEA